MRASSPRSALFAAACAVLSALALGACGEREEPEIAGSAEPSFSIEGRWSGELRQQGLEPFRVRAEIAALERTKANVVHYSGIDCAGTWEYLGATDTAYRFREVIDSGAGGKCKGTGTVTLTPLTQNEVAYRFRGGGVASAGDLQRD